MENPFHQPGTRKWPCPKESWGLLLGYQLVTLPWRFSVWGFTATYKPVIEGFRGLGLQNRVTGLGV